ncbi:MAG: ParA family protein, partial [Halodesulfurarchaeum sp.]
VPPVVSNQAVGAVTAVDRAVAVVPPTGRGVDALQRERGRLADVGTSFSGVLSVGAGDPPPDATARIPARPDSAPAHRPASLDPGGSFTRAVTGATAALLAVDVDPAKRPSASERLGSIGDRFR